MSKAAISQCRQDLTDIRNTRPVPFSDSGWKNFKMERLEERNLWSSNRNDEKFNNGDDEDWENSHNLQNGVAM